MYIHTHTKIVRIIYYVYIIFGKRKKHIIVDCVSGARLLLRGYYIHNNNIIPRVCIRYTSIGYAPDGHHDDSYAPPITWSLTRHSRGYLRSWYTPASCCYYTNFVL